MDTGNLRADGNWQALWKLKISLKLKHFSWRLCRYVLPTRSNLRHRHVDVEDSCPWCVSSSESAMHLFIHCAKATACWESLGIFPLLIDIAATHASIGVVFFVALNVLAGTDREAWCMTLWSLWHSRNAHIWENKQDNALDIVWVGNQLLNSWQEARVLSILILLASRVPLLLPIARKCGLGRGLGQMQSGCFIFLVTNKVGVEMCLRDDRGNFIKAKLFVSLPSWKSN